MESGVDAQQEKTKAAQFFGDCFVRHLLPGQRFDEPGVHGY
jgi:hypothetical protein